MKAIFILGTLLLCPIFTAVAQKTPAVNRLNNRSTASVETEKTADAILGEWMDDQKTVQIQVYKKCNQYHARIVWLKDEKIARLGTQILEGLEYTQKNTWQEGKLYYPRTDNWYDCRCTMQGTSIMKVRVYIGTPLLGKTIEFNRSTVITRMSHAEKTRE